MAVDEKSARAIVLAEELRKCAWKARNGKFYDVEEHLVSALASLHTTQPDIGIKDFLEDFCCRKFFFRPRIDA